MRVRHAKICIKQNNLLAHFRQAQGQIHRAVSFAYAAFAYFVGKGSLQHARADA